MFRYGQMYENSSKYGKEPWLGKMTPFKIIANTYFVGTYQASCHLIDTGEGLILIDPGYFNTLYLVVDSIRSLGFDPADIKYIVCTHWHSDHTAATRPLVGISGAKTAIGELDGERCKEFFTPDILIKDGDELTLGDTTMHFMHTPGHTAGTVSFFYDVREGDKVYRLGMFGGAGVNTLSKGTFEFEGCREAYLSSLGRLRGERVDVMLGNHTWNNDTYSKSLELLSGGENKFIDSELWGKFIDNCQGRLMAVIEREGGNA